MTVADDESFGRQIVSIALAGAGLILLAASPDVSMSPWSRIGGSIEWAVRVLRAR